MVDGNVLHQLNDEGLADKIIILEETTSTNDIAKSLVRGGFRGKALITAELQTAGRGRMGRNWSSPAGTGIWMSYLISGIEIGSENISFNTLLAGLSVAESLREYAAADCVDLPCLIKWPNDIVVNGRKICGILTEFITEADTGSMIIGIGINTGQESFPEEIADKATSYLIETGTRPIREEIIKRIIGKYNEIHKNFEDPDMAKIIPDRYAGMMVNLDKEVILTSANGDFPDNPYIARGITEQGDLIVEDRFGRRTKVTSGEVSVRGVLGYV